MPFREGLTPAEKAQFISEADQILAEDRQGMRELTGVVKELLRHENGDSTLAHAALTRSLMDSSHTVENAEDEQDCEGVVFRLSSLLAAAALMLADRDETAEKP